MITKLSSFLPSSSGDWHITFYMFHVLPMGIASLGIRIKVDALMVMEENSSSNDSKQQIT